MTRFRTGESGGDRIAVAFAFAILGPIPLVPILALLIGSDGGLLGPWFDAVFLVYLIGVPVLLSAGLFTAPLFPAVLVEIWRRALKVALAGLLVGIVGAVAALSGTSLTGKWILATVAGLGCATIAFVLATLIPFLKDARA